MPEGTSDTSLTIESAADVIAKTLLSDVIAEDKQEEAKPESTTDAKAEAVESDEKAESVESKTDDADAEKEDEKAEESEKPEPKLYRAKVDGEEVEVTEDELLKSYAFQSHNTKRAQAIAAERKTFEADRDTEAKAIQTAKAELAARLGAVEEVLAALTPAEPDWDQLRKEYPEPEVDAAYRAFKQQQERLGKVKTERDRIAKEREGELKVEAEKVLTRERELLHTVVPEWTDPATEAAGLKDLVTYAKGEGFSEDELRGVVDHRLLVVLRKAELYDKAQKSKPTVENKIKQVLTTVAPGASTERKPMAALTKAKLKLAQTGRPEDAAAVIERMLE